MFVTLTSQLHTRLEWHCCQRLCTSSELSILYMLGECGIGRYATIFKSTQSGSGVHPAFYPKPFSGFEAAEVWTRLALILRTPADILVPPLPPSVLWIGELLSTGTNLQLLTSNGF